MDALAVVGILLPKMLESYEVLQAYCAAAECDANYRLGIAWYGIACFLCFPGGLICRWRADASVEASGSISCCSDRPCED